MTSPLKLAIVLTLFAGLIYAGTLSRQSNDLFPYGKLCQSNFHQYKNTCK